MSEHFNTAENPQIDQEDEFGHSLHVSNLSPTSQLLLSPYHSSGRAHSFHENHEKDIPGRSSMDHLKQQDVNSTNVKLLVNHPNQYNDVRKTVEPTTLIKTKQKAFSHEKLYSRINEKLAKTTVETRSDHVKQDMTFDSFHRQHLKKTFSNTATAAQNVVFSFPSAALDKVLPSGSQVSGLRGGINNFRFSNEERYGSLISKRSLNIDGHGVSRNSGDSVGDHVGPMVFEHEVSEEHINHKKVQSEHTSQTLNGGRTELNYSTTADSKMNGDMYFNPTVNHFVDHNGAFLYGTLNASSQNLDGSNNRLVLNGQRYGSIIANGITDAFNHFDGYGRADGYGVSSGNEVPEKIRGYRNSAMLNSQKLEETTVVGTAPKKRLVDYQRSGGMVNYRINGIGYENSHDHSALSSDEVRPSGGGKRFYSNRLNSKVEPEDGVTSSPENDSVLFNAATQTTEVILSQIFDKNTASTEDALQNSKRSSFGEVQDTSKKQRDFASSFNGPVRPHDLPQRAIIQTNVTNYYDKIRTSKNAGPFGHLESSIGDLKPAVAEGRRSVRSKSSEFPLKGDASVVTSLGLSHSWSSSKTRQQIQAMKVFQMTGNGKQSKDTVSQKDRIALMFRVEGQIALKRAQDHDRYRLQRKTFTAWVAVIREAKLKADQLCKAHLLKKGINALKCAVERHARAVAVFQANERRLILRKYWQTWQSETRASQRKKMQDMFTQWHYYKLHMERERLLNSMATRHILSKKYSKWKEHFNMKQKNSIATVHFKINLIYKCWECWILYVKQRWVKNRMNGIANYHYRVLAQRHFFQEWRERTQKSLFCWRLARIVHLRLQNMCKEYHKRCVMTRSLKKWRQALRTKQSIAFWKRNQLRRTLKLWRLRHMRKKLHKHLCKALARKAKKRRFFEKWIRFSKHEKQTRTAFVKRIQDFCTRRLFNCWRNQTMKKSIMRKSLRIYQSERSMKIIRERWESWKFQMKILELRKRSKNNWSLGCARKCCSLWKRKVKKVNLVTRLDKNCYTWKLLMIKRFFRMWRDEYQKARLDYSRSVYVASILRKNSLARVFQAWRVVNQEDCIMEPLVKRRERKEMARVYDAWRHYLFREKYIRTRQHSRIQLLKRETFSIWRDKLSSITKVRDVEQILKSAKLQRNFLAWLEYVKDLRLTERMQKQKTADMLRSFIRIWKEKAEAKAEARDRKQGERAYHHVLLVSYFTAWKRKTSNLKQKLTVMENLADTTHKRWMTERSFKRWIRQYSVEVKTSDYLNFKKTERLRSIFIAWKDFASDEFERQVCDFATNLALDSSQGSLFLSTSGYQTSLKNSTASFQYVQGDEMFSPYPAVNSRPVTPFGCHDDHADNVDGQPLATLPSYRPVTVDTRHSIPGYQTPPLASRPQAGHCRSPLTRQRSSDQLSQSETSPQRSSEDDDGVPSSGVHSAGEESDQDDRISIHLAESLLSFQTTSECTPRDRELLVTETIIHWRSLSLSVAFRSWCKYTKHMNFIRALYADCMARNRERLLTEMLAKWRRWLFVTVLARQHWIMHMKKKYLLLWSGYRQQQILNADHKVDAEHFSKKVLLRMFFAKWKTKKTAKCQLQSIVVRWQKNAVFTDTDKVVIQQFNERDKANCLKRTFLHWRKMALNSQLASSFYETLMIRRCFTCWRSVACWQAGLRKTVNDFRNNHLMAKTFKEWRSRYEDNRTAKILIEASEDRKTERIFKAWRVWASAASYRRKTYLAYHRSHERKKTKAQFIFWSTTAKKYTAMKEHYKKSLQRRILKSWRNVLTQKANTSGSIQDFQEIVQRNTLKTSFAFWRTRAHHNQLLSGYLKERARRKLGSSFDCWTQQKRILDAEKHHSQRLKKKVLSTWCHEILKRKKARHHFKYWHTVAEGTKELNQVADSIVRDSENKLLRMKFSFWKQATRHAQVARYHHSTKLSRRFLVVWHDYTRTNRRLSENLKEFQVSHQKNNFGLLRKYMKIWKIKSAGSTKAEQLECGIDQPMPRPFSPSFVPWKQNGLGTRLQFSICLNSVYSGLSSLRKIKLENMFTNYDSQMTKVYTHHIIKILEGMAT